MADVEIRELNRGESALAHAAMLELRPSIGDGDQFATRVDQAQRAEGYRMVGVFAAPADPAVAVAGFRLVHNLAWGDVLYVDDLSTLPQARRQGHGGRLLRWLLEEAQRQGCDQLHLDSGVGPQRADAHRPLPQRGTDDHVAPLRARAASLTREGRIGVAAPYREREPARPPSLP